MTVVRLPVAGLEVVVRPPAGAEDVLLVEAGPPSLALALDLLARLARRTDGAALDPAVLSISDVDVLLLCLRRRIAGDEVSAVAMCPAPGCRARVDVGFSIDAYLVHHLPEAPAGVEIGRASCRERV